MGHKNTHINDHGIKIIAAVFVAHEKGFISGVGRNFRCLFNDAPSGSDCTVK
jgi:hypothetical protein